MLPNNKTDKTENFRLILAKKPAYQAQAQALQKTLSENLNLTLESLQIYDGFDVFDFPQTANPDVLLDVLIWQALGDPVSDVQCTESLDSTDSRYCLSIEYLPGQFDQRADAGEQVAHLLDPALATLQITSFKTYVLTGSLDAEARARIKTYLLNPTDSREKDLSTLNREPVQIRAPLKFLSGFIHANSTQLLALKNEFGLALTDADLHFIQQYFQGEGRDPSETEIRVLDTYWSDHCRHTTFLTQLEDIRFSTGDFNATLQAAFTDYLACREQTGIASRPITLMDLATINARYLRHQGQLDNVEISDEINACSVFVDIDTATGPEKWLLQFKNETHNHPTEIEPFGGASTCLGGAIRDPLSGRAYVYQALRLSGAANPLEPIANTLTGKLPQQLICKTAAKGFAAYGNQIGVASTQVCEIYHPGYQAKRLEVGAVVAATPAAQVCRQAPQAGDIIVLIGGRTGRDGCGGASGSSKSHTHDSLRSSGAEVQKGNPPVERAIQRLFRHPEVAQIIKKCNDFGAGGVCVAIGELADGLTIDLGAIPTKYQGLSATELTISESQERMAVVLAPESLAFFQQACQAENVECSVVANVTDQHRLQISLDGEMVVDLCRDFLDSAGAPQTQTHVTVTTQPYPSPFSAAFVSPFASLSSTKTANDDLLTRLSELANASQAGLQDTFDSNVGASTVLLPYGGARQLSPAEGSVQLLPHKDTHIASILTWGFDAQLSQHQPFLGGAYAVVHALCRQVALGANWQSVHFSLQEYFEKLGEVPEKWGKPFAALLGAFSAQRAFELAAIGGKDSMSGSFADLHVPPTLIAFAVSPQDCRKIITSELQSTQSYLYLLAHDRLADDTPNYPQLKTHFAFIDSQRQHWASIQTVKHSGVAVELAKAALGNRIGFTLQSDHLALWQAGYGSFVLESDCKLSAPEGVHLQFIGQTHAEPQVNINGLHDSLDAVENAYLHTLNPLYPDYRQPEKASAEKASANHFPVNAFKPSASIARRTSTIAKPQVFIPVFPGTNSEYDLADAFTLSGGKVHLQPLVNLDAHLLQASLNHFCQALDQAQIFALPGGFSAGDEPNGSGKFIAAVLKNTQVADAVERFLARDGLILGICNGFQALVKSGLLPSGAIRKRHADDITLDHNFNARHIARIVRTRVCQTHSPWLSEFQLNQVHDVAVSHGEGRLVASERQLTDWQQQGQIAFQYVDAAGQPSMAETVNPNGSDYAIEGLLSPCGKILGKMGHSERQRGAKTYRNYPQFRDQKALFDAGVRYFK